MEVTWRTETAAGFNGKKKVCVPQWLWKRAHISGSVAMGGGTGGGILQCPAKLELHKVQRWSIEEAACLLSCTPRVSDPDSSS